MERGRDGIDMSAEKIKKWLIFGGFMILLVVAGGCGSEPWTPLDVPADTGWDTMEADQGICDDIAEVYREIYADAGRADMILDLETMKKLLSRLGEKGYVAVDSENQIDMVGADQVRVFCGAVDAQEDAELTIIEAIYTGGFRKYDLQAKDGKVDVTRGYYEYGEDGVLKNISTVSYLADFWQYTEEGYLLFEGNYYSEESYVLTLSDVPERTALRVQPLDEECRELNRKYILPVGYQQNNMFLVDWAEEGFGELDFYDLFDAFYPLLYNQPVPYTMGAELGENVIYRIAKNEFENVISAYFNVDSKGLQSRTAYLPEDKIYEYRPRGFGDAEYPDIPYPEVVSYTKRDDGVIELTVNAVYRNDNTSKAFSHKVVVRTLEDGSFQYVSNRMIFPEDGYDAWWHSDRSKIREK